MGHTAEISRTNPACFLFLVDQSSSMLEPFGKQPEKSKAIRDYFDIGAIVYGGQVAFAFGGALESEMELGEFAHGLAPVARL